LRSRIESTLPVRNVDTSAAPVLVNVLPNQRNEPFVLVRPGGAEQPLEVERRGRDDFAVAVSDFAQRGIYRVTVHEPASAGDANAENNGDKNNVDKTAGDKTGAVNADGKTAVGGAPTSNRKAAWGAVIAANGPADESKLASIDERGLAERMSGAADVGGADSGSPTGTAAAKTPAVAGTAPASTTAARYQWIPRGQPISLTGAEIWGQDTWWWLILTMLVCLLLELTILAWPTVSQSVGATRETA
jgi:hypothetical protein